MAPTLGGGQAAKMSGPVSRHIRCMDRKDTHLTNSQSRSTRNTEYNPTTTQNTIDGGTQSSKPFGSTLSGANGWGGTNIWGNNNSLTATLAAASRDRSATRGKLNSTGHLHAQSLSRPVLEHSSFLNNGTEQIEGKTGSRALLGSPETDGAWSSRKLWTDHNGVSSTRRGSGMSPARQRPSHNNQSFMDSPQSAQALSQNRTGVYPHDTLRSASLQLDTMNHGFIAKDDGDLDMSSEVDRVLGYTNQRSKSLWPGFAEPNAVQSPTDDRRSVTNSEYFGSANGSLPPSRNGTDPSAYQAQDSFSRLAPNQGTPNRAQHNPTLSGPSLRSLQSRTNSFPNETSAMFDRLSLHSNLPNNVNSTHRPSISNVSMSGYLDQLSNSQRNMHPRANLVDQDQAFENSNVPTLQSYTPEGLPLSHFPDGYSMSGPSHFERGAATPGSSEVRSSPYYSAAATPPLPNGSLYTQTMTHARNVSNPAHLDQRLRSIAQQEQQNYLNPQFSMYAQHRYPNNNTLGQYPFQLPNVNLYTGLAPQLPMQHMGFPLEPPRGPREQDANYGIRSTVLEEFKSNNKGRRWELKDIMEHVVEFAGDQHGSRFIQSKLETANSDEKEAVYRQLQDNALQLMQDVFGNYVIQKFFEHGDQTQKELLAKRMKRKVFDLSKQMYGCRVVQKVSLPRAFSLSAR